MKMIYSDNAVYFLTGSTFLHFPYFRDSEQKEILLEQVKRLTLEQGIRMCAFSIQSNHYHVLFYAKTPNDVLVVKKYMHGGTSYAYKKKFRPKYKIFWGTHKIVRVFTQESYYKIVGYICGNLLKHHEVGTFDELMNNPYSSYSFLVRTYTEEVAQQIIRSVIYVDEDADGAVNNRQMKLANLPKELLRAD